MRELAIAAGLIVCSALAGCAASPPPCVEVAPPSVQGRPTMLAPTAEVPPRAMPPFETVEYAGISSASGCPTVTEYDLPNLAYNSIDFVSGRWALGGKTGLLSPAQRDAIAVAYRGIRFIVQGRVEEAKSRVRLLVIAAGQARLYEELWSKGSPIEVDGLQLFIFHNNLREILLPDENLQAR
jgi:hypothetical protein